MELGEAFMNDDLGAARGILLGLAISIPLWAVIIWAVSKLL